MLKRFSRFAVVGIFALGACAPALAASISGTVSAVENGGRTVAVKGKDGKAVKVRVSGSRTSLTKGGKPIDRGDVKVGNKVKVEYDEKDDRKTASAIVVK